MNGLYTTSGPHRAQETDGARIRAEAGELAFPRYPGTEGDRRIIATLEDRFSDAGMEVGRQGFSYDISPAERALRVALVAGGLLIAAAGLITPRSPVLGLLLVVAAVVPGVALLAWSPWLEALYRRDGRTRTANVWGRRPARNRPVATLIVMAHHDSKSQSLTLPIRLVLTLAVIGGTVVLTVGAVAGLAGVWAVAHGWFAWVGSLAAASSAVALSTMKSGNQSPGGVDNAGSVAIVLELARTLPAEIPDDVELVFLSTGAEEDHMVGAMRWLDSHAANLQDRPVWCLNFDGAGAPGRTVLIERYGLGRLFSREMSNAARRAARRLGIPVRGIVMLPAVGIDAIPFAHRGIPCLTLSSGSLGKATMSVHSANDRAEHLDAETLGRVAILARELIHELLGCVEEHVLSS